jgi:YHS domain-containing protein
MNRTTILRAITASGLSLLSLAALAIPPVFQTTDGAIRGYDPVAYFTQHKPVKGDKQFTVKWQEAEWHFANAENKQAFEANPEKYAPQYGGYCAYGVAQGYTPETDPAAFKVVNDKLYLNLSPYVLKKWSKDIKGYVKDADGNWPKLRDGTFTEKQ